jgi:cyclase
MTRPTYRHGLQEVADGVHAYLQPDGGWGWSNASLVTSGRTALLIDTLFDLKLTAAMLAEMAPLLGSSGIETVVNTHANGDHCWGNQLLRSARIVASRGTAEEMRDGMQPGQLAAIMADPEPFGPPGAFLAQVFAPFNFGDITVIPPSVTFERELTLHVGPRELRLIAVGPAHTRGDTLAWLPAERVLFTGDIVFNGGHPIVWDGPFSNWTAALELIVKLDPEVVVPGHGPVTDVNGALTLRRYFDELTAEARRRFDAGQAVAEAAMEITLDGFEHWGESERLAANVVQLYREFGGEPSAPAMAMVVAMARRAGTPAS